MILSAGRCFPCFVFIFPHYREKILMVNTMESEVYEGDVYNSLTASIFELGNGSEFIFLGIWLGKPFWRFNGWRGRLGHQFSTGVTDMVGSAFQKNTVVAMNWQFVKGYMKEMKVTTRPQTFGKNELWLCKMPHLRTYYPLTSPISLWQTM